MIKIYYTVLTIFLAISLQSCGRSGDVHFINTPGARIFYQKTGEGRPLMVLQGHESSADMVTEHYSGIIPDSEFITFDPRGVGRSQAAEGIQAGPHDYVQDAEYLRKELGLRRINIIAHGEGCKDAVDYAMEYSKYCASLILVYPEKSLLCSENETFLSDLTSLQLPVLITSAGDEQTVLRLHDAIRNSILIVYSINGDDYFPADKREFFSDIRKFLDIYGFTP